MVGFVFFLFFLLAMIAAYKHHPSVGRISQVMSSCGHTPQTGVCPPPTHVFHICDGKNKNKKKKKKQIRFWTLVDWYDGYRRRQGCKYLLNLLSFLQRELMVPSIL